MNSPAKAAVSGAVALLLCLAAVSLSVGSAAAQESRGSVTGQVTDAAGASVPNAAVTATNVETNTATRATTNAEGVYLVPYLLPGAYTVTVEAQGFKKLARQGVEVRVGDRVALDLQLETGQVADTVTVTGESTPLLDAATATSGQVIDRRRISDLPLAEGNPMTLVRLAPTTVLTDGFTSLSALSSSGPASFAVDGSAQGGNEFTLDGAPNTADKGGQPGALRVGMQPPVDAVQEFKVTTTSFDAQQGHTAGASIDVSVRSGANDFHGTLYEFIRNDKLSANTFFLNRSPALGLDENGKARRTVRRYNRFGGTIGGPVWFPGKVFGPFDYDGHNKTFFFVSYEEIRIRQPSSETLTLPNAAFRSGDFSSLPAGQVIYDPFTATQQGARVVRQPLMCNGRANVICPNRISAIAAKYLSFLPLPNLPGTENNYLGSVSSPNDYRVIITRVDHNWNERHKSFFRFSHSHRNEFDEDSTGVNNGVRITGRYVPRGNRGGVFDHIFTSSPTTIFNLRVGYTRFLQTRTAFTDYDTSPAALGFSPNAISRVFGDRTGIPGFDVSGYSSPVENTGFFTATRTTSVQPTLTKIFGNHSTRFGYDFRVYQENTTPFERKLGSLAFNNSFTRPTDQNVSVSNDLLRAQSLASLLLGVPTGGSIPSNPSPANLARYHGIFFQDDWKVSKRLTLNLGLRYELEETATERFNRNIRGFDLTATNPASAAAQAAYARAPIPEVPAANFRLNGGLLFVDENNRTFYDADKNNFQPRIGFAFQINEKTVLRGGFAMYTVPFTLQGSNQTGFATSTPVNPTNDVGLTFVASLADPYPNGLNQPTGSSLGLATFLGQGVGFIPTNFKNGQSQKIELSLQRELPGRWLAEIAYVGNRGYDLIAGVDLNPVPAQYLSRSPVRDQATIDFLTANVTNPFRGIEQFRGSNFFTATTVQRQQLLRPFPHFTGVGGQRFDGSTSYHSGQVRLERRFSNGYTVLGTYAFSKGLERLSLLNPTDTEFENRLTGADSPHRVNLSFIYELPWGRGRRWGSSWGGWKEALVGGVQVQGIYFYQSGFPITLGNIYYNGDIRKLKIDINSKTVGALGTSNQTDNVFQTNLSQTGFYFQDAAVQTNGAVDFAKQRNDPRINLGSNIRTLPSRVGNLRGDAQTLTDLSVIKNFAFTENVKLQLRVEMINAFNNYIFRAPDLNPRNTTFGRVTNTDPVALPREYQIGLKLLF
jgi:hypothetical protein